MAACSLWPRAHLPADYAAPFQSNVPAVHVSGDLDPVSPPEWSEAMRRYLPNSVHVIAPGAHLADNPCLASLGRALFLSGSIDGLDTSCVSALQLPPFETSPSGAARRS